MAQLDTYTTQISQQYQEISEGIAGLNTAVNGVAGDVAELNKKIAELQGASGNLSNEQVAALEALIAQGNTVADSVNAAKAKAEQLDALNPAVPPTPTPTP